MHPPLNYARLMYNMFLWMRDANQDVEDSYTTWFRTWRTRPEVFAQFDPGLAEWRALHEDDPEAWGYKANFGVALVGRPSAFSRWQRTLVHFLYEHARRGAEPLKCSGETRPLAMWARRTLMLYHKRLLPEPRESVIAFFIAREQETFFDTWSNAVLCPSTDWRTVKSREAVRRCRAKKRERHSAVDDTLLPGMEEGGEGDYVST